MQDLQIKETFAAIKIDWKNCLDIDCQHFSGCSKIRPVDSIQCKIYNIQPFTIYRSEFIKNNSGEWIKIK
jgi:hypothetical protein